MDYSSFIEKCILVHENPDYDFSRFERFMKLEEECEFDGVKLSGSKIRAIQRFCENTNVYNRSKVGELINNNVHNFSKVYKIVMDYRIAKGQQEWNHLESS